MRRAEARAVPHRRMTRTRTGGLFR